MNARARFWVVALVSALVGSAQAQFSYITNNGAITITGYAGSGGNVSVPSMINGLPVTQIGDGAFQGNTSFNVMTLPSTITNLGARAFSGCTPLLGVNMPPNLPGIADFTFAQCSQLTGLTIPPTATFVGVSAFEGCGSLRQIRIPDSVTSLGNSAFASCQRLTNCILGSSLHDMGSMVFASSGLPSITIPAGVASIGQYAFETCSQLGPVYFVGNAPEMDYTTFYGDDNAILCHSLTSSGWNSVFTGLPEALWDAQTPCTFITNNAVVTFLQYLGTNSSFTLPTQIAALPVVRIGDTGLSGMANVTSIDVGAAITNIGNGAFSNDTRLKSINFQGNAPAAGADLFSGDTNAIVYYLPGTTGWGATFGGLPAVLWDSADQLGFQSNSNGLTIVQYRGYGPTLTLPHNYNGQTVNSVGPSVFTNVYSLSSVDFGNTISSIGNLAFANCWSLTNITFGAGLTNLSLGASAFSGDNSLRFILFQGDAPNAGTNLFSGLSATVYYLPGAVGWGQTFAGLPAVLWDATDQLGFQTNATGLTVVKYLGPGGALSLPATFNGDTVNSIGAGVFQGLNLFSVDFGNTISSIGSAAFANCGSLTSITFGAGLTNLSVANDAFSNDLNLRTIFFGGNAPYLGTPTFGGAVNGTVYFLPGTTGWGSTFAGLPAALWDAAEQFGFQTNDTGLTLIRYLGAGGAVTIPTAFNGLTINRIGAGAFQGASSLRSIDLGNNITSISNSAFSSCVGLTNVSFGTNVTTIGTNAFAGCVLLANVTLPESLTWLGDGAFEGCSSLTNITVSDGLLAIGSHAFDSCSRLTEIVIPASVTNLGAYVFSGCSNLTSVFFLGDAPTADPAACAGANPGLAVYYEPGTDGWGSTFGGVAAVIWDPVDGLGYTIAGNEATIRSYGGPPGAAVHIPSKILGVPVTRIGAGAFQNNTNITSMTIADSVIDIGSNAFSGCIWLLGVVLPHNLTSIADSTFYNCWQLTGMSIPAGVTNIGNQAFFYCVSLTQVYFPSNVVSIGTSAFEFCWRLNNLYSGGGPANIGPWAFAYCGSISNLFVFDSVRSIGTNAFAWCTNIASATLGTNLLSLDALTFNNCTKLQSVTIGRAVTNVSAAAFAGCSNLNTILVNSNSASYSSVAGALLDKTQSTLLLCPLGRTGSFTIPSGVVAVASGAFQNCVGLTDIIVPASVTNIGANAFSSSGLRSLFFEGDAPTIGAAYYPYATVYYIPGTSGWGAAFAGMATRLWDSLSQFGYSATNNTVTIYGYSGPGGSVTIPTTIAGLPVTAIGDYAFQWDKVITSMVFANTITNIGYQAFGYCYGLTNVLMDDGLLTIGPWAFAYSGLKTATIPQNVSSIIYSVFAGCTNLATVVFGRSTTNFMSSVFQGCSALTSFQVDTQNPVYSSDAGLLLNKSQSTIVLCPPGKSGAFSIPDGIAVVGASAFAGCYGLTQVTIPESVTDISNTAFYYCTGLTSVRFGREVVSIGSEAFEYCTNLVELLIPNSVTTIGSFAFFNCSKLIRVFVGSGLAQISYGAFEQCSRLQEMYFAGNAPTVDNNYIFYGDPAIAYYFAGTTGWGSTLANIPAVLWNPQMQTSGLGFGVGTNGFGFAITGNRNVLIVVEASTNLSGADWVPVSTNMLTGSPFYFSDPGSKNFPKRFYRLRTPF